MAEKIEASYDELEGIAGRFRSSAEEVETLIKQVSDHVENLRSTWAGRGSEAFLTEMDTEVFPALKKLQAAFAEGETVVTNVVNIFAQAEEEASGFFAKE